MMKYGLSAVVAAGLLAGGMTMSTSSASAADLGGNCCADLEERIAELEATTARKGNRKVSLTVSGWVGQQVTWWDDGGESNVYVHDLGTTLASHVKFTGQATIVPGWTAGYVLHLEAVGSDSLTMNQDLVDGPSVLTGAPNGVGTLQSFWFIKSDQLGKVSVGKQSQASDNTAILVDGSGSLVPANWVSFDVNNFFIRNSATGNLTELKWGAAGGCVWGDCNGLPTNSVRYDSPTFAGFSVSASWGEDDFWDVAARYAGEHHGFKVAIAG
ncbi:porin, partial [Hyphomicrobium methylovorum]|uniref:porin n=1 Tax=Hyphomicrobium methylovorum TaxID=84 RepID=UPI0015E656B9